MNDLKELLIAFNQLNWKKMLGSNLPLFDENLVNEWELDLLFKKIVKKLNQRITNRLFNKLHLPPFSTEKDFDELLDYLKVEVKNRKEDNSLSQRILEVILSGVDFERFVSSAPLRNHLNSAFVGRELRDNFYTRFVFEQILLQERDYIENITKAFLIGSDGDTASLLARIGNGDSDLTVDELQFLASLDVPYFDEFYIYMKSHIYNVVDEFINDIQNPIENISPEDLLEHYADNLMNTLNLRINGKTFQILAVEGFLHSQSHPDEFVPKFLFNGTSGRWCISDVGVFITFSREDGDSDLYGGMLISAVKDLEEGEIINDPSEVKMLFFDVLNSEIEDFSPEITFVEKNTPHVSLIKSRRKDFISTSYYGNNHFADLNYRFVYPLTADCI